MNKVRLAYLAGVMDSDGYFTIKKNTYNIRKIGDSKNPNFYERVGIKQVQPEAIDIIHKNFGGYKNIQQPNTKNGKPIHGVQLTNLKAHYFIKAIYPYLLLKKKQATILLHLRQALNKGRNKKVISTHKDRWGNQTNFTRYALSDKQVAKREQMLKKIKSLNDSRNDPFHTPLPY